MKHEPIMSVAHPVAMISVSSLKPATNQQVRSKFLNMIGIESKLPPTDGAEAKLPSTNAAQPSIAADQSGWVNPRPLNVAYTESLKYDRRADERMSPKRRKTGDAQLDAAARRKPKKKLNFNDSVSVVPIPMRTEYSNRVRSRLWSNAMEIHENAARNTIEFAAEGYVALLHGLSTVLPHVH